MNHFVTRHRGGNFQQRPTQDNRYLKPTRSERAGPPEDRIQSDDPDFSAKVRIIHRLIKAIHHLKNVSNDIYPPSLNKLQIEIPDEAFLFSIDIDSLYTNIDIQEGINSDEFSKNIWTKKKRPDKELIQLLEINLTRNDFEFNGDFYLQVKGYSHG